MTDGNDVENECSASKSVSVDLCGAVVHLNEDGSASEVSDDEEENCKKVQLPSSALPENSVVNIENSNDVIIGPVTQFHGPVTIYQNTHNNAPLPIDSTACLNGRETIANSSAKLVAAETVCARRLANFKELPRKKLLMAFAIFLIIICSCIFISISVKKLVVQKERQQEPTTTVKPNIPNSTHKFIDRYRWGGRDSLRPEPLHTPVKYVIISHTGGHFCTEFSNCSREMQKAQSESVVTGHPDVVYNFVIGGDGNIYIGRGWDVKNDHKLSVDTIDISFIGNFVYNKLTDTMIDAAKKLLQHGIDLKKLDKDYRLYAHNQTENTVSPGSNVYAVIRTWPHFTNELLTDTSL